jgi:peptidoglycan/xylan/chitin deacetylase (PgdA/CDA1 family)
MEFAPAYPLLYRVLKPLFPGCLWSGATTDRTIALTFDDGPHPHYTPQLLAVLERYNVTASFFWLGQCVQRSPTTARTVYKQGHWLGLHGYDHQAFSSLSATALKQTLARTKPKLHRHVIYPRLPYVMCVRPMVSLHPVLWHCYSSGNIVLSCGALFPKIGCAPA